MSTGIDVSARSDVGCVRQVNEDGYVASMPVFLVADGMGGHARGDRASAEVTRVFARLASRVAAEHATLTPDDVIEAIHEANRAVRSLSDGAETGIAVAGTTLAGVVQVQVTGGDRRHWMIVNVGDSRVYRWDGRALSQVSVDHSAVQELLDAGIITAEEAVDHPERNVITRALGAEDLVDVDVWLLPVEGRQTFLICSDGLTKELDDDAISLILVEQAGRAAEGPSIADVLVDAAVAAGGHDNVTVIFVESAYEGTVTDFDETADRREHEYLEDTRPRVEGKDSAAV